MKYFRNYSQYAEATLRCLAMCHHLFGRYVPMFRTNLLPLHSGCQTTRHHIQKTGKPRHVNPTCNTKTLLILYEK
jgi:hypothetical protein